MELESLPGIGERTADRLAQLEDPERTVLSGDVAHLIRETGLSEGRAVRIARSAIRHRHDDHEEFLRTERADELYRDALALLKERAVTEYAEKRLETLYPSTTRSRIEEVQSIARDAMAHDPEPSVLEPLSDLAPLETPTDLRVRERCLATSDAETHARAQEQVPELSVELIEKRRELADLARGYSSVIVLDEAYAGLDLPADVQVMPDAIDRIDEIVPERLLAFFAANRTVLLGAAALHAAAGLDPACDPDSLRSALDRLSDDGTIEGDEELADLQRAVDDLETAVSTAESVANDHLREAIQEQDVTIAGSDLLSLVEQGAQVDSLLERELAEEFDAAIEAARSHLADALGMSDYEALTEQVFTEETMFPVERDGNALSRLRSELTAARDQRATRLKADLASDLAELRDPAERLVENALEFDVELAIARFAADFDCVLPTFEDDNDTEGFAIEGGRSPLLDVPFETVEPIEYAVEGCALLSGVNSGGKTATIDLVGLCVILAQMGLPVPAKSARLERFDALYYQEKNQGTLDAGAFEATLRSFGDLLAESEHRLVLVDELESITEPGASAKIIAGILESLAEQEATGVFVSHLAREIRESAAIDLPVDGIEATGLENGELQVERSPVKGRLARSTPELIVEKIAADSTALDKSEEPNASSNGANSDDDSTFYDRLLRKFDKI